MATAAQIATLRDYISEPDATTFTDERLGGYIDAQNGDLRKTAGLVWEIKAAGYAEMVDVSEGGSSRKLGDLYEQAIAMATRWSTTSDTGTETKTMRPARTRPIVRP